MATVTGVTGAWSMHGKDKGVIAKENKLRKTTLCTRFYR